VSLPINPALAIHGQPSRQRFPINSRYASVATSQLVTSDGSVVTYLQRRFIPQDAGQTLTTHVVVDGERVDHLAARYLGDAEQFWRLCDGNGVMRVTLPSGVVGPRNA
jgi:hypothetical protein